MKEIMNKPNLKELADLLNQAIEDDIGIVHVFNTHDPKGGLTLAFRKSTKYKSGHMVDIAIATCSIKDTFNKRIGNFTALQKFYSGEVVSLPLLVRYEVEDLNWVVKQAFTEMYKFTAV